MYKRQVGKKYRADAGRVRMYRSRGDGEQNASVGKRQEEDVKDYIRILDIKSQRLKSMVQDVFEISKAASKQLPVNLEDLDLGKLLRQTLALSLIHISPLYGGPRTFCRTVRRVVHTGKVKRLRRGAVGKPSLNRARVSMCRPETG